MGHRLNLVKTDKQSELSFNWQTSKILASLLNARVTGTHSSVVCIVEEVANAKNKRRTDVHKEC